MREIGTIENERDAQVLKDHLVSRQIPAKVVKSGDGWSIWVINEDAVPVAKEELSTFIANPTDDRYRESGRLAREIEKAANAAEKSHQTKVRDLRERWDAPAWRKYPLTVLLIAICAYVGLATSFGDDPRSATFRALTFTREAPRVGNAEARSDPIEALKESRAIRQGEYWRLVTPIFLHFDLLHLFGNMLCLRVFGGLIEFRKGSLRFLLLVLISALASNLGQFAADTQRPEASVFGGMSGVGYALFGYLMTKGFSRPEERLGVSSNTVVFMMIWFVLCVIGVMGNVANTAHGVGLVLGMLIGLTRF